MSDNWWGGGGESSPTEEDYRRAGYTFTGGDSGEWVPPAQAPAPPPPPAPSAWNTPGQALKLDGQNSQWTFNGWRYAADFKYNGVPVVFVPREFVEQGFREGQRTTYSDKWGQIAEFMKPAVVDRTALAKAPKGAEQDNFWKEGQYYQAPTEGYIVPSEKFNAVIKNFSWVEQPKRSSGFIKGALQDFGDFISGMPGPVKLALSVAVPNAAAFFAGFNATQAIQQGEWGKAVVASLPLFVPSPSGQAPVIAIPGMENAVGTLSKTLNVSAATAGQILQGAVELAANGGDLKQVLQTRLAAYLGDKAGTFVTQFAKDFPIAGIEKLVKSVTTDSTKALLLNQDVSKAATAAFANEAVPLAFNSIPGYAAWEKQNPKLADALKTTAINTAKTGDLYGAIRSSAEQAAVKVIAPLAEAALTKDGIKLNDAQRKLLENTLTSAVTGKPLDSALQTYALDAAKLAVKDQVAKTEGWASDAQKQGAKGQYGSAIKPDDYTARQQGWEDLAAKQAAIKSYGDTITPVGVKERDQVKSVDPKFDAEAYLKLNEVTGDPFQHFLTQGNKAKLPTNYESGADAALKSLGYKASPDEVKQVADLFKKSADPDVALGKFYDEHWVTQEEAAAAAKQAGFTLTPEQLKTFVGQTTGGQNTVFEDVARAARIGYESQQQRTKFLDSQMATVKQAYKDQGYSDEQINAALPNIRNNLSAAIDQKVNQAADYANQVKAAYGENSKEYAAAQKKLLETQAATGSAGVAKYGNEFRTISGETRSADTPTKADTWMADKTKAPDTVTGESGDFLRLTTGSGTPSKATEDIKTYTALIGIPGQPKTPNGTAQENISGKAIIGELPSGTGTGKVPTLFGIPLAVTAADLGSDAWQRVDQSTWITPDRKYTFIATPGGGEVRDTATKNVVVTLPPADVAKVIPTTPAATTPAATTPAATTPTVPVAPAKDPVAEAVAAAQKAADEGRISQQEAADILTKAGYVYSPDEVGQFTGAYTPAQAQAAVAAYIGPRMVTAGEVAQAYKDLGLANPTQGDINKFVGQRPQDKLAEEVKQYLPTAGLNLANQNIAQLQQQVQTSQQQANMGTLFGLLGGFGGQQAPTPAPQPTPLANIGYVYDIGGKSIFATPQQEKAFVSPYAEGGTVEDLMKILRG